jgi:hypothetical protein
MAPTNLSSKGKPKVGSKPRSRNTTPLPNVRSSVEPAPSATYFHKPLSSFLKRCDVTVEELLDSGGGSTSIPSGSKLLAMREKIESTVLKNVEKRCEHSEGALRELQGLRKNRVPREREKDKDTEDRERKHKLKKLSKKHDEDGKHPPTIGAHGVTRQDGIDVHKGTLARTKLSPFLFTLILPAGPTLQPPSAWRTQIRSLCTSAIPQRFTTNVTFTTHHLRVAQTTHPPCHLPYPKLRLQQVVVDQTPLRPAAPTCPTSQHPHQPYPSSRYSDLTHPSLMIPQYTTYAKSLLA